MSDKFKILAISGSTRKSSSNLNLIKAIAELSSELFAVNLFDGLTDLPHFNPDLDGENAPEQIIKFRQLLKDADGVLICTPEYAIGVPGTLKNAIDWTVSSMEFSQKPVALITASTSGEKAHASLLGTLLIIESKMTEESQLVISGIKSKVSDSGQITDQETLAQVQRLIDALGKMVRGEAVKMLPPPSLKC
ncbi:NADPH-dependent FMN reductase [Bdellovibrio svalbardensis]|uniref:NAD(P)H-dependent oxidoreductase n=1 Tax=Bdellovibrio svalbardensis TaxID=2972972 RepID=A0ABT6DN69_9BACT|nr:NADPH-dependent FMN reductase [Bdellovibrio svalbardensis]MDG0816573.1 NAD(P)H-dependent oxidoreductase [Bdellovibrio svalbardensis]